ncbi:hypothetical protein [Oscillibacter sp.]|uniref:hypothetical protein n=1 Tax=Oscillibacter sp. TaxID=1945593 RepID=UPI00261BABB7|nr:hypothetical protein [Oscillibacter sp.]
MAKKSRRRSGGKETVFEFCLPQAFGASNRRGNLQFRRLGAVDAWPVPLSPLPLTFSHEASGSERRRRDDAILCPGQKQPRAAAFTGCTEGLRKAKPQAPFFCTVHGTFSLRKSKENVGCIRVLQSGTSTRQCREVS